MRRMLIAFLSVLGAMLPLTDVQATTWLVNPDGSGDTPTIQEAINVAASGDTVLLSPGAFKGPGNKNLDFLGKPLVLRTAEERASAVIDCEGDGRGMDFFNGETPHTRVEDIAIINGNVYPGGGGAIRMSMNSSPTISGCLLENNQANRGGAIGCWASSPEILDCRIINNTTYPNSGGGGITIQSYSAPLIANCWIADNYATYTGGIEIYDSTPVISFCTIVNNSCQSMGGGIGCQYSDPIISQCTLVGNASADSSGGIFLYQSAPGIWCCVVAFSKSGAGIWCFWDCSTPTILGTDIWGNADGDWIGCVEGMDTYNANYHVDPMFCDWQHGDYHLMEGSLLLSPGQLCDDFVGAWGLGCSNTAVRERATLEPTSWGSLKSLYR